jgi:hypothetical protein
MLQQDLQDNMLQQARLLQAAPDLAGNRALLLERKGSASKQIFCFVCP